jgi:4-phospho-D-threonate 3-dehydrogenase / 4-phospho-D-erythronate 3-dehydrogenase
MRNAANWILVGERWLVDDLAPAFDFSSYVAPEVVGHASYPPNVVVLDTGQLNRSQHAFGHISSECGMAGLEYVRIATELCLTNRAQAIVTAPLNKEAVTLAGQRFCGHTEFIAELCGVSESRMMLWNEKLAVVHVSTHISLSEATRLNRERILKTIQLGDQAYQFLLKRPPRIAVCGLNPHAGENGLFGSQEQDIIIPAIEEAKEHGIHCLGPLPADTLFLQAFSGAYDLVVAMYHDQGHIPMKLMDFDHTVNVTLGLPIIRTSVDHGTAFDIAGKNLANAEDMISAMDLAIRLSVCRQMVPG